MEENVFFVDLRPFFEKPIINSKVAMKITLQILSATALIVSVVFGISSCSKSSIDLEKVQLLDVHDEQSAMENFSVALSSAVYSYPEVRDFLKAEALKRFDYEDEVFYPFVKEMSIGNLGTFREILVRELGGEEKMAQIEKELPTLTILVSDASWFDPEGFCLDRWDTSEPCVAVTYREKDGICRRLFGDGYLLGEIEEGTLPGGPVLIVKESERMVANVSTKSESVEYSFLFDEFDASKNPVDTKARYSWEWLNEEQPDSSDLMSEAVLYSINPDLIKAYNLFKNNSFACQNDYIFYGMTSNSTKGRLRTDVKNKIYRLKLLSSAFPRVFDDSLKNDIRFKDTWKTQDYGRGYEMEPTKEEVYAKLWGDGLLELKFTILAGSRSGTSSVYPLSVNASDLFAVKDDVVMREQWKASAFVWHIEWRYTFGKFGEEIRKRDHNTLAEKWYYLPYPIELPSWDLLDLSFYTLKAEEVDSGASKTIEITVTTKHADESTQKFNTGAEYKKGDWMANAKLELGWNQNDERNRVEKQTITVKEENDILFEHPISYSDKYVLNKSGSKYSVASIGSGDLIITILPYRY